MKKSILILFLLIPFFNWAQLYSINWDGATQVGWTVSTNPFNVTNEIPCQGTNAVRAQLQGNQTPNNTSVLTSSNLGTVNGGALAFTYDYKWLVYQSNMNNPIGAPATQLSMTWQWANDIGGPWYTFETRDAQNHVVSPSCTTISTVLTPYSGNLYLRLIVTNLSANSNNYFYLDEVEVSDEGPLPDCLMPEDIYITNKTSNGFTLNWSAVATAQDYEWEVRTSGEPGSGPAGLVDGGISIATSDDATGLAAQTSYKVYIRSNCSPTESSNWIGIDVYTFCNAPAFNVQSPIYLCGVQQVELEATGAGGRYTFWYDENDSLVAEGVNTYLTPEIDTSTFYKVFSGNYGNFMDVIDLGTGAATLNTDEVPFGITKANKVQYIYHASELEAEGFTRGIIKGFGILVGPSGGTLVRNNFEISMGLTSLEAFGTRNRFIPQSQLQVVKNTGNDTLVAGEVNMFSLDDPFIWDGTSNIVVQVVYSDLDLASPPSRTATVGTTYQSSVSSNRTIFASSNVLQFNQMKDTPTGTRSEFRVNGFFDVIEGCFDKMEIIDIDFTEAPSLVLSDTIANNCAGQPLDKIYVMTGANDFDEYEWILKPIDPNNPNDPNDPANDPTHPNHPDNAVGGDQNVGWTFNPDTPTTYYLTARQTGGGECVNYAHVHIELNPSPTMLQLQSDYSLCYDDIEELKVDNFIDETPSKYLFNGNLNGVSLTNTVTGDAITNDTTLFSEGNGSLKVSYAAQTNAVLNFSDTINMRDLNSITVEFDHIAALQANETNVMDYGYVEYSTDNGSTWKPFLPEDYVGSATDTLPIPDGLSSFQPMFFSKTSYPDWDTINDTVAATNSMWKSEKFVVPESEFTGSGAFKVRFRIGSDGNTQYDGWYIDNVRITPISNYQVTWSPIADLYYDQNATIPYDGTINVGKVYLKGNNNVLNKPYTVTVTNQFGCSIEDTFNVSIGLNELPGVTNTSIDSCGPVNVANTGFTKNANGTLSYYNSLTSTSPITQITTSGTYYVEQEISGCKSQRVPFTVIINAQPTDPVAPATQSFCGSATVNDLQYNTVAGFQIKWYSSASGGTALNSSTPLANGASYYAEFDNGTCFSDNRAKVDVTVGATPSAISVNDIYICGTTTTIDDIDVPSATGATVHWYQSATATTALASTTVLTTGTYYVSQKIGTCESTRTAVNVSTIQNLSAPSATTQTFCGSATVADLVASGIVAGATENWYSFSTSDTPLDLSSAISSGTYYVGQSIGDCHSPKQAVSVRILSVNAPTISPISICGDATVASLPLSGGTGVTFKVYDSAFATTELGQNAAVTSGTYYISKVESGCETARAAVHITVTALPASPTGNAQQEFENYAQVSDLVMNESNIVWYASYNDAINGVNPLPSYIALENNKTYYAVIIGPNGCPSLPTAVEVTITLGMNDLDLASLKYYPNPTDSELTVSYKEPIRSIEVYDLAGKQVKVQQFDANEVRINVSTLASGTYMVKVQTDTGSQFIKVVKK